MFDWNDEEITNIIWGEAKESDDHIVPYPDGSDEKPSGLYGDETKKEWNEGAEDVKLAERKSPIARDDVNGVKSERSSQDDRNESRPAKGPRTESWPDISLSSDAKTDPGSMGTEASKLSEISKHDSSMRSGENAQASNCSEIFENQQDREQGDFVDYDWANIGSFDDLDRIFRNDDPTSGHTSLNNEDALWSSFKDVTRSPEKCIPLSFDSPNIAMSTSDQLEIKSEYVLHQDHPSTSSYGNMSNILPDTPQDLQDGMDAIEYTGVEAVKDKTFLDVSGRTPAFNSQLVAGTTAAPNDDFTDKGNRQKRLLKTRVKSEEKREVRELQEICSTWSTSGNQFQQFDSQYAPMMEQCCSPSLISQQRWLSEYGASQHKHLPCPLLASSMYVNTETQYPPMAGVSQLHSGKGKHQKVALDYEVSPSNSDLVNKLPDATTRPLPMTPQEKIEKLRRRQQMRAMLAIQRQQQQLNNQVSSAERPIIQRANTEAEGNMDILLTLDPNSPAEHYDSNTTCISSDDSSAEESVLSWLQDIIGKMDIRIRLCIRDSLFRLAQSTKQRKYASDTSSGNRGSSEVFTDKESYSHNRMPDVETETNPIDRTVAHLLFHRPLVSSGKNCPIPASPLSPKLHCERKEGGSTSFLGTFMAPENDQMLSHDESNVSFMFSEEDQTKGSLCVDSSENGPSNEAADGAASGVESR